MQLRFPKNLKQKVFLGAIVVFIFMAQGTLGFLHKMLPLVGSARWAFSYVYFAQIFVLFYVCSKTMDVEQLGLRYRMKLGALLSIGYLVILATKPQFRVPFDLLIFTGLILMLLMLPKKLTFTTLVLTTFHAVDLQRTVKNVGEDEVSDYLKTEQRHRPVNITINSRATGKTGHYDYRDRNWIYKKVPSMNGYNNSVHPIFWYLKGTPLGERFVIPLCGDGPVILGERGSYPENDNAYLEGLRDRLLEVVSNSRCGEDVTQFQFGPSEMRFTPVSELTLIVQNMSSFESVGAQRLPGGMLLMKTQIGKEVRIKFKL
jgi:hypothetical protein